MTTGRVTPSSAAHDGDPPIPQAHDFLGARHDRNARRTVAVLILCAVTMAVELIGGWLFHSMALIADGLHMATHVGVMFVAGGAYWFARRCSGDPSFSFGTGKVGDLAAFASAVALASTAVLIGIESIERLINPLPIAFGEAIPIAFLGLAVNVASIWLLHDDHDHAHHEHEHDHGHAHHDHNLRAAYIHVLSDAGLGIFAILGLAAGRWLGWTWLDPIIGIAGAFVILRWAIALARASGSVLLDRVPDTRLAAEIRSRIERDGAQVRDLHLWRLGPGHHGLILSLAAPEPLAPAAYRAHLAGLPTLSHVTIEVERA